MADRARALVDRTRAGLGARGLAAPDDDDEEVFVDEEIQFNMDFIRQLTRIHKEATRQIQDMKKNSEKEELNIVINGISGFLSEVSGKFPGTARALSRCQDILQRFLDGGYDEERPHGEMVYTDPVAPDSGIPKMPNRSAHPGRHRYVPNPVSPPNPVYKDWDDDGEEIAL
jgi:hypothetical protein